MNIPSKYPKMTTAELKAWGSCQIFVIGGRNLAIHIISISSQDSHYQAIRIRRQISKQDPDSMVQEITILTGLASLAWLKSASYF